MKQTLLRPTSDFIFKKIFGANKIAFQGLVSAILNQPITDITFLTPKEEKKELAKEDPLAFLNAELLPSTLGDKLVRLDVCAKLADGKQINLEVQVEDELNFLKRVLFYGARFYTNQLSEGETYDTLKKTICISILSFTLFPTEPHLLCHHALLSTRTKVQHMEDIEFFFLQLPCLEQKPYNQLSELEKWSLFFQSRDIKVLKEVSMDNKALKSAVEDLETLSKEPKTRALYEAQMKFVRDFNSRVKTMWERGLEEGTLKGIEEGKAEGLAEGKLTTARNMKKKGFPTDMIAEITDLPFEAIENL